MHGAMPPSSLMILLSTETKEELQPGSLIMNYTMNCTMNEH